MDFALLAELVGVGDGVILLGVVDKASDPVALGHVHAVILDAVAGLGGVVVLHNGLDLIQRDLAVQSNALGDIDGLGGIVDLVVLEDVQVNLVGELVVGSGGVLLEVSVEFYVALDDELGNLSAGVEVTLVVNLPALEGVAGLVIGLALSVGNLLAVNAAAAGHVVGGNGLAVGAVEGHSDSVALGSAAALGLQGDGQGVAGIDCGGQGQVVALFIALGGDELIGILPVAHPAVAQDVVDNGGLTVHRLDLELSGNRVALVVNNLKSDILDRLFRLLGVDKQLQEVAVVDTGILDGDAGSIVVGSASPLDKFLVFLDQLQTQLLGQRHSAVNRNGDLAVSCVRTVNIDLNGNLRVNAGILDLLVDVQVYVVAIRICLLQVVIADGAGGLFVLHVRPLDEFLVAVNQSLGQFLRQFQFLTGLHGNILVSDILSVNVGLDGQGFISFRSSGLERNRADQQHSHQYEAKQLLHCVFHNF